MRRFVVFAGCQHGDDATCYVQVSDGATEGEIAEACGDALGTLISSEFHTGWDEVERGTPEWREAGRNLREQ